MSENDRVDSSPKVLIAGLGNWLLQDDGVGIHAVRALENDPEIMARPNTIVVDIGTAVLDAFHLFEWADVIIALDAMRCGGPPGSIYLARAADIRAGDLAGGLHEVNLVAALQMLGIKHHTGVWMFGVEPDFIDYGTELTPLVQAALPVLLRRVKEWLNAGIPWARPQSTLAQTAASWDASSWPQDLAAD